MKTSIKAIIAATVTAALSLGIVTAATADTAVKPNVKSEESSSVEETEKTLSDVLAEPSAVTEELSDLSEIDDALAKELEQLPADIQRIGAENAYTDFEMKLLERKPATPFPQCYINGKFVDAPVDVALEEYTDVKLTLVGTSGYNRWEGRFVVDSVKDFEVKFTEPQCFSCKIGGTPVFYTKSGIGMDGNYKKIKTVFTYRDLDYRGIPIIVTYPYENSGNQDKVVCWDEESSSKHATLIEATYYFTMYAGSGKTSPIYETAMVHVVNSSYAQSAAYAQNSYANLIDKYTYVDTSELLESESE
ncbi:MAG: hypothetical protein HDT42_05360 [Ruminococcaceae bacterium]|nr:hypothetical protein [Oscillospiraceae bacterium]